ncbi:MAG: hypothetical protein Kow0025_10410 [Thermodesulfovibrionales bacterium]
MKGWSFFITLIVGVALGVAGMVYLPEKFDAFLPGSVGGKGVTVEGTVMEKMKKDGALLLTVNTPQGALLATVKKRVDEVGLLVGEGDRVEFVLKTYRPFIEDPVIKRVRKGPGPAIAEVPEEAAPEAPEAGEEKPAAVNAPAPEATKEAAKPEAEKAKPEAGEEKPAQTAPKGGAKAPAPSVTNAPAKPAP